MSKTAMAVVQLDTEDHQSENGFVSLETESPGLLTRIDSCVLPFLGGFGKYQRQLIVLTWIPALFIGFSQYSDEFLLAQPNNTCVPPMANTTNLTRSPLFHGANNSFPRTAAYVYTNGTHNYTARHLQHCMCKEWTFELHTGLIQNVVTKWSLVCDSAWKVHIAKFSLLVGSIFGYLVFGVLADWFGRHPVLIISVLFMLVFGLTVAFSVNVPMFSTLRFFEGFCLAGIILSLYILRIELCLPAWRFSMTMVASFVVLGGQLLMPGMAYLCRDWQVLQAVIICPLILMVSYIWIFPESLRWLLATQQYGRSKWIMGHIAKKNQVNTELDTDHILTELQKALQKKPKKTCIVKMVGTRNLWKNIVVLCVNSLTGYGIHHCFARSMMDHHETHESTMFHNFYADYYTMAGIAVASCIALCPAVSLMGRRGGLLMFMIITALASLLQLGLLNLLGKYSVHLNIERSDTLNKNFSIAFSIIGMFSSHAVSNLSIFFCAEITPTVIRGGGLGLVLASAGFGMLTAPIMELHNQKGYFLHHIIFACCTLICIICILLLPETRYQPLPETLADGECYTRQPLLPPRKPGEQRLLLSQLESNRDYTRVHDTPLHEAAATAVSTMEFTASSAVDRTAPSAIDISAPSARTLRSHQHESDGKSTEDSTDIPLINSVSPSSTFIVDDETAPSPTKDVTTDRLTEDTHTSILVKTISPVTETLPISLLESTIPPVLDSTPTSALYPSTPPVIESTPGSVVDPSTPPVIESTPSSVVDPSTPPVIESTPGSVVDPSTPPVIESTPGSVVDPSTPPVIESTPSSVVDPSTPPVVESTPGSVVDPSTPPVIETTPSSVVDPSMPPVIESAPTSLDAPEVIETPPTSTLDSPPVIETTPTLNSTIPPVIETTPTLDSTTPPVLDLLPPSPTPSPTPVINDIFLPPPMVDCTTPIDSADHITTDPIIYSLDDKLPAPLPPTSDCTIPLLTDSVHTPELDSSSPCVNNVIVSPAYPFIAHSPVHPPIRPLPPPPNDSGHIPTTVDSSMPPVMDTVHRPTVDSTTLPITDIVQPLSLDSTIPLVIDSQHPNVTDSETTEAATASTIMDCTISSPIDLGILPIMDCTISENRVINGVASS
ncbi:solute carrier family 22 member 23-like isoform X1 [Salvelinus namaycush]|uniref:Solute carrier family 22 member 23-like isoform X1 n=1 Tax=Salvelinus namaycush TaxID=8040 RepID=A0A8U0TLB0_SALNM|nr:solute carrier family 22 member 23-like isoform X1 [Salvelinus namaycush]